MQLYDLHPLLRFVILLVIILGIAFSVMWVFYTVEAMIKDVLSRD